MRCKPGDLAVVVRSTCGNEGRIVQCIRLVGDLWKIDRHGKVELARDCWVTEPTIYGFGGNVSEVRDAWLRPIRDNPGTDETLIEVFKRSPVED